jgi:hypothetical protein
VTCIAELRPPGRAKEIHLPKPPLAIRNQKDFAAGLLYICSGAAFAIGALNYKMGSADRMGPAYFPFWLGMLLALIGVIVLANSVRARSASVEMPHFDWKVLAWILGSVAAFGVLLTWTGLLVALVALVLISSMASHEFKWMGALLNAALLLALCLGAFVYGLGLQLPLWPSFVH